MERIAEERDSPGAPGLSAEEEGALTELSGWLTSALTEELQASPEAAEALLDRVLASAEARCVVPFACSVAACVCVRGRVCARAGVERRARATTTLGR
jgi:hypothetical protein